MLTSKQYELLIFINERIREGGVSPSFDEMKDALDLKSKSGIHRLINALEERGFIRRLPNRARALEVLRLPETMAQHGRSRGFSPNVIEGSRTPFTGVSLPVSADNANSVINIPMLGRIAAGTPIEALEDRSAMMAVPTDMLGAGAHFALEVQGDSMINAGIFDGDIAIVKQCDTAENGTIVVALVDGQEVTLKRLRRKGASIALEPANPNYKTRICGPDQVAVQGRLVGIYRKYH
ncbi:MAG: transcriptional repressor LexA [Alphaproteobacteria bacterium]|nr:transcriptional repressor LexA [Alphaproteobacteria bacterium]